MSRTTRLAKAAAPDTTTRAPGTAHAGKEDEPQIDEELLIEEISIDGMCGVY